MDLKNLFESHFNEIVLAVLVLVLTAVATWILAKENWQAADGFKWASGLVETVLGALLALLMKQGIQTQPQAPKPEEPPKAP